MAKKQKKALPKERSMAAYAMILHRKAARFPDLKKRANKNACRGAAKSGSSDLGL